MRVGKSFVVFDTKKKEHSCRQVSPQTQFSMEKKDDRNASQCSNYLLFFLQTKENISMHTS